MNDSRELKRVTPDRLSETGPDGGPEPRWRVIACFLLMLAAIQLALGPKIWLSQWGVSGDDNAAVAEGVAWLKGQTNLDLPKATGPEPEKRIHDTAYHNGKVYNVFPPLMAILTVVLHPLHDWYLDLPPGTWIQTPYTLLIFWPLPIVGFIVFRRQVRDSAWAALLTLAWMGGTAVLPNLHEAQRGYLGQINHIASQVGLLIFAADLLGRQRIWPALIGLLIATYTRQLTFLYGLPLLYVAWQRGRARLAGCLVGLAVIAAPLLTLNYLKFGDPLDFGYRYIYVGRGAEDYMGERYLKHGMFSPVFIPKNFYYMHLAPPRLDFDPPLVNISADNQEGTSMWITTPLAAMTIIAWRWWWPDPKRRLLMLGTVPVMVGLWCYHSPGFMEYGYNRFALDFLPIWLVVIAAQTRVGWRTWFTLGCTAWSLLYFQTLLPNTPISWIRG